MNGYKNTHARHRGIYRPIIAFLLFLFAFGGLDAILFRDVVAFSYALYFTLAVFWSRCFPVSWEGKFPLIPQMQTLVPIAAILGFFMVVMFVIPTINISRDTTYLTAPLLENKQEVDYFQALADKVNVACDSDDNGFKLLVAALEQGVFQPGIDVTPTERRKMWETLCKKLNVNTVPDDAEAKNGDTAAKNEDRNEKKVIPFIELDVFLRKSDTVAGSPLKLAERLKSEPWTKEEYPEVYKWVQDNQAIFDTFAAAVRKPMFVQPLIKIRDASNAVSASVPIYVTSRIAKGLPVIFQYHLGNNDSDAAWEVLVTQFRFANLLADNAWFQTDLLMFVVF
ncbi:MAG: hypothetical protein ACRC2T_14735, partial [Thermoguttaceae bacterium]